MVRTPRSSSLDALAEIVFDASQHHRRVVDSVYLGSCERHRILAVLKQIVLMYMWTYQSGETLQMLANAFIGKYPIYLGEVVDV